MINVEGKTSESLHEAVTVALLLGANDQPGLPFFQIIANNKRNNEKCNIHLTKCVCFFFLLLLVVSFEVVVVIADKEWAMGSCSFYAYPAMANKARL